MATLSENLLALNEAKQAIKTAIENKGQDLTDVPFSQYAEKIDAIEGSGSDDSYYDSFWDLYQQNGSRSDYYFAFAGHGWTDETFKPKYDIVPSGNYYMFQKSKITDLKGLLEKLNVKFDVSKTGYSLSWFAESTITRVPKLDLKSASSFNGLRGAKSLKYVEEVVFYKNCGFAYAFDCTNLEHCIFSGTLAKEGFNTSACTLLDKESLISIVNCLSNETNGLSITVSKVAVDKQFETGSDLNDGSNSSEWQALIDTKTNWTINLV